MTCSTSAIDQNAFETTVCALFWTQSESFPRAELSVGGVSYHGINLDPRVTPILASAIALHYTVAIQVMMATKPEFPLRYDDARMWKAEVAWLRDHIKTAAFRHQNEVPLPLALGVRDQIVEALAGAAEPSLVGLALRVYTGQWAYLHALAEPGAMRHDLDGRPPELVSAEHAASAVSRHTYQAGKFTVSRRRCRSQHSSSTRVCRSFTDCTAQY